MGWSFAGKPRKDCAKPFGHRLSLLAALDTDGRTYFAVSQSTTDQPAFGTFLHYLARVLDAEDPEWREHSLILLDGASYHTRKEIYKAMAVLNLPIVFAGPYAFDSSPAEKLFAYLKVGDINPA